MAADYERLDVYCDGCHHKAMIPWRLIGRPIVTPLARSSEQLHLPAMRTKGAAAEDPWCEPPAKPVGGFMRGYSGP